MKGAMASVTKASAFTDRTAHPAPAVGAQLPGAGTGGHHHLLGPQGGPIPEHHAGAASALQQQAVHRGKLPYLQAVLSSLAHQGVEVMEGVDPSLFKIGGRHRRARGQVGLQVIEGLLFQPIGCPAPRPFFPGRAFPARGGGPPARPR